MLDFMVFLEFQDHFLPSLVLILLVSTCCDSAFYSYITSFFLFSTECSVALFCMFVLEHAIILLDCASVPISPQYVT